MPLRNFQSGQEVVAEDLNAIGKAALKELYDKVLFEIGQRKDDSFFSDSFKVNFSNPTTVLLKKGLGFQKVTASSPDIERLPVILEVDQSMTIQTPDSGFDRIDLICVKSDLVDELSATRKYKDAATTAISNQTFVLQKKFSSSILVVVGTPAALPVAPSVPSGFISVASLLVSAVSGIANQAAITDLRSLMPFGPDITIDTTLFNRLAQNANYKLKDLLAEIDSKLPNSISDFTLVNNQAAFLDLGLAINVSVKKKFKFNYAIKRKTDSQELNSIGDFYVIYNSLLNTMEVIESSFGDDCEVDLRAVLVSGSSWKLQYKTSNVSGTGYSGSFSCQLANEF